MVLVLTLSTPFIAASLCIWYAGLFSLPLTSELGILKPLLSRKALVGGRKGRSQPLPGIHLHSLLREEAQELGWAQHSMRACRIRVSSPNQACSGKDHASRAELYMLSAAAPRLFSGEIIQGCV